MKRGSVWQRHRKSCPRLPDGQYRIHKCRGPWAFEVDVVRREDGRRRRVTKSGFPTKRDAEIELRELLVREESGIADTYRLTVGQYLEQWLVGKRALRPTTLQSYRSHLDLYLLPHLGSIRLADLRPHHLDYMYDAISNDGKQRSATTMRRIHGTLKSALSSAVKRRLIPWNPAVHVELPRPQRFRWWSGHRDRYVNSCSIPLQTGCLRSTT